MEEVTMTGEVAIIARQMIGDMFRIKLLSMVGLCSYWLPVVICITRNLFKFNSMYVSDTKLSNGSKYEPSLTVGFIAFRLLVSLTPLINTLAGLYYCVALLDRLSRKPIVPVYESVTPE